MKLTEDNSVRYLTKIDDRVGGPYTVEGLASLVYLQKINPDTLIGREGIDAFIPIRNSRLGLILFPGLQAGQSSTPDVWTPPGQENDPAQINRKRYRTTEATFENVNASAADLPKIDVYDILGEIRQAEIESGHDFVRPSRWRLDKRDRDFWVVVITGNTVILGGAIAMQNTASIVFGIAGSGLFTFGLLWSMYGVMGRY